MTALMADPVNGNIEWVRIEALLVALECRVIEGPGSAVTFEHKGRKANFHRPHPGKEALRYRVKAVREFCDALLRARAAVLRPRAAVPSVRAGRR